MPLADLAAIALLTVFGVAFLAGVCFVFWPSKPEPITPRKWTPPPASMDEHL